MKEEILIKIIEPTVAKTICREISQTLPEWFGIPEANARYEEGMLSRTSFAAYKANDAIGLITVELQYPGNGIIYWLGVKKKFHGQGIGTQLLRWAENFCITQNCVSLTVETLSPENKDKHYLQTYQFYKAAGFWPLFSMHPYGPELRMLYMQKTIGLHQFEFIDLTHTLSSDVPHWGVDVGFKYNARLIETKEAGDVKFRVQRLEMSAGIGTHMDAPSHITEDGEAIHHLPLKSLITTCCVIDVSHKAHENYSVSVDDVKNFETQYGIIAAQTFVIVYTGWAKRWQQPDQYRNEKIFPNISAEAAEFLLARNIVGIGIDTLSPDAFGSNFPVHQIFLGAGKYIIENVAHADLLDPVGNFIFALPIKVQAGTEAPMRLVALKQKVYVGG